MAANDALYSRLGLASVTVTADLSIKDPGIVPGSLGIDALLTVSGLTDLAALGMRGVGALLEGSGIRTLGRLTDLSTLNAAERLVADELTANGKIVLPIARSTVSGARTADLLVDGVKTEIKTVVANGPNSIKNAIEAGSLKPGVGEIIVDARGSNSTADSAFNQMKRAMGNSVRQIGNTKITIMTKDGTHTYQNGFLYFGR